MLSQFQTLQRVVCKQLLPKFFESSCLGKDLQKIDLVNYDNNEMFYRWCFVSLWSLDMSTGIRYWIRKDKNFDLSTINQVFWKFYQLGLEYTGNTVEGNNSTTRDSVERVKIWCILLSKYNKKTFQIW